MSTQKFQVFDARVFPPTAAYAKSSTWTDVNGTIQSIRSRGWQPTESIINSSLHLFIEEVKNAGIIGIGLPSRIMNNTWGWADNKAVEEVSNNFQIPAIWYAAVDYTEKSSISKLVAKGAKGIVVEPYLSPKPVHIDDPLLDSIYQEIQDNQIPALIMMGGEYGSSVDWCNPARLEVIANKYPELKILVVHAGWPLIQQMLQVSFRCRNIYLLPDVYFPGLPGESDLVLALKTFMADRILYGSGYPYCPQSQQLQAIKNFGISDDILQKFFCSNADALFDLGNLEYSRRNDE